MQETQQEEVIEPTSPDEVKDPDYEKTLNDWLAEEEN